MAAGTEPRLVVLRVARDAVGLAGQAEVEDLTRPSRVTKMFSGFRSRCTMPLSCAAARPRATCTACLTATAGSMLPDAIGARSVVPSSSSVTTNGAPS
jgi:hypothetical protein